MITGYIISMILLNVNIANGFQADKWLPPLNNVEMIRLLCTEFIHKQLTIEVEHMKEEKLKNNVDLKVPILTILPHGILCRKNFTMYLSNRKYEGAIWFMKALDFCDINRIMLKNPHLNYSRYFQIDMLRAGYSLVCQKTDDIGRYQLSAFADLFRIIYEKSNVNRPIICNRLIDVYQDLYGRCHVDSTQADINVALSKCHGNSNRQPLIKLRSFFSRFSRQCQTLSEFYQSGDRYDTHLGDALANDTVFMNMLSGHIKRTALSYSLLPHLVLKTRLLLQHFPLAAIKVKDMVEAGRNCKQIDGHINLDSSDSNSTHHTDNTASYNFTDEECKLRNIEDINTEIADEFVQIGQRSLYGVFVELLLLCLVLFNSTILSILLMQTKEKLSTATILFVFNILFSNFLFIASFLCMFSDLYAQLPYGIINEEQLLSQSSAALIIAETLQTHLFASSEFFKHLVQETLYSLAQNGSLLGLTHLLVLVLVVINKSMSGKAIKLSRKCVVFVFAFVWAFLFITHLIFSALQFSAITNLDHLFSKLNSDPGSLECSKPITSDYQEIGVKCDRVAVFHTFGVYLLRGHTLFTLIFLVTSILVYAITLLIHIRVRAQHHFLSDNMRDHSPHKRRETLFNTLLLSIGAFFISVLGQSFVEIAVFWVDDRNGIAQLATYYQYARIIAFVDPLFNPILVAVRTPTIRRRLRYYIYLIFGTISMFLCPWRTFKKHKSRRKASSSSVPRKRSTGYTRRPSSTTGTIDSRPDSTDSEITLKFFCTTQKLRSSLRRNRNSTMNSKNNSVI